MLKEFKDFISKGNTLSMAIGVVMGAAFTAIVNSLVKDILMPPLGMLIGKVDFSNLFFSLDGKSYASLKAAQEAGAPTVNYGMFLNNIISFLIVAIAIFSLVKLLSKYIQIEPKEDPTKECPYCKSTVPEEAIKCPNCTSELPALKTPVANK